MTEGARRIRAAFDDAGRPLFMPYVMGGYPDPDASVALLAAAARHADLIELGIPFSDPLADGPTIQAAGQRALEAGTRPEDVIEMAAALEGGPPVVLMTYVNVILAAGPRSFMERAARAGVTGVIIPDLPIDEGEDLRDQARRAGLAVIPFAAPTTGDRRMAAIGEQAEGFVYCVAVTGVTGAEIQIDGDMTSFLARARATIDVPLAVGFGVRTPAHVAAIGAIADGVIVGSELIKRVGEAPSPEAAVAEVEHFCSAAVDALRGLASAAP
jgi:tryptophan synthase alpha chain